MEKTMNWWGVFLVCYIAAAVLSLIPTIKAALKRIDLKEAQFSFKESPNFSDEAKKVLEQHYSRLQGTLVFWKNNAAKYGNFHHYCIFWTIFGGIIVPILTQAITEDPYSKWALTVISAHVALLYALHKGLKIEDNYQNYRMGESEYYDIRRKLLDRPKTFGDNEESQINEYFQQVEFVRKEMRNREVGAVPSIDEIRQEMERSAEKNRRP
jgi:hypothetical protein